MYPFLKKPEPDDALYECQYCKHNCWRASDLIGVLCPRCGRSMERI